MNLFVSNFSATEKNSSISSVDGIFTASTELAWEIFLFFFIVGDSIISSFFLSLLKINQLKSQMYCKFDMHVQDWNDIADYYEWKSQMFDFVKHFMNEK